MKNASVVAARKGSGRILSVERKGHDCCGGVARILGKELT